MGEGDEGGRINVCSSAGGQVLVGTGSGKVSFIYSFLLSFPPFFVLLLLCALLDYYIQFFSHSQVIYLEVDKQSGEITQKAQTKLNQDISCLDITPFTNSSGRYAHNQIFERIEKKKKIEQKRKI